MLAPGQFRAQMGKRTRKDLEGRPADPRAEQVITDGKACRYSIAQKSCRKVWPTRIPQTIPRRTRRCYCMHTAHHLTFHNWFWWLPVRGRAPRSARGPFKAYGTTRNNLFAGKTEQRIDRLVHLSQSAVSCVLYPSLPAQPCARGTAQAFPANDKALVQHVKRARTEPPRLTPHWMRHRRGSSLFSSTIRRILLGAGLRSSWTVKTLRSQRLRRKALSLRSRQQGVQLEPFLLLRPDILLCMCTQARVRRAAQEVFVPLPTQAPSQNQRVGRYLSQGQGKALPVLGEP